ncbi:SPOR domain-containing protein [Fodinibius sp.]|uniref:SPOR domain-containing protein n=1 Tax=Fodinibius sp. TaxID=1872440 RepID=UPI002ACD9ACD|nr:SPOR domain-containing protein [Fodinibius sp.]MDZ7660294.1 SPOR domain-containing protein [Fodinibius sp.]
MKSFRYQKTILFTLALLFVAIGSVHSQNRDNLPAEFREYTNPEEVVRFDRTTSFARAVDVINEFSQQFRNKAVINRTDVEGEIGISVPPMHWMDALKLILRVKELHLVDKQEFFEIVTRESLEAGGQAASQAATGGGEGEGPVATTQTHEVRINAIFFEGNRRALQEIGVDWSTISENVPESVLGGGQGGQGGGGGGQGGQQGQTPQIPNSQFDGDGPFVQVNSKGAQSVSQNVFNALINVGEIGNTGIEVQTLFSAFEADNLGEILASPTIKVMDGQEGNIQVGQDFSIKQRDIAGNVVEQFFSVGTILTVTPQVLTQRDTTFIHLDIEAERSSAQPDPVSTIINKQEAQTQALLLDGEATVIAGLYRTEKSDVRRGIPILKDLPPWFFGLRYLFGYESHDYQMRELVILIQASLEPTIPERYGKEDFRNKYEVLQDERERMQGEVSKGQKIMNREKDEDLQEMFDGETEKKNEQPHEEKQEEEKEPEPKPKPEEKDSSEDQQSENAEADSLDNESDQQDTPETMKDPEVKTEKVELNLGGGEDSLQTNTENQTNDPEPETSESEEDGDVDQNSEKLSTYYVIGGSFRVMENAREQKKELAEKGFNASIIMMPETDIHLVTYQGFDDLDSAKKALADIRQNQNSEAWVYKAK